MTEIFFLHLKLSLAFCYFWAVSTHCQK